MTTPTYTDYPFTSNGVKFISRIFADSPFAKQLKNLPEIIFQTMNMETIQQAIGDVSLLTKEELLNELARINEGGTHAFVLLDEGAN
jgi:hypothetical protein